MKLILFKLPEYYLIILAILSGYSPPFYIHPIMIGIVMLLILQIILKNRIAGLLIGVLFFLLNLYFLGALLSEFNEFSAYHVSSKQLLFTGLFLWTANLLASSTIIYKYSTMDMRYVKTLE